VDLEAVEVEEEAIIRLLNGTTHLGSSKITMEPSSQQEDLMDLHLTTDLLEESFKSNPFETVQ
jgi:hypothetical protein